MHNTLRPGSRGSEVTRLQMMLNKIIQPKPPLGLDGDFGTLTDAAVKKYQQLHGLQGDGIVGPHTWKQLDHVARKAPPGKLSGAPPARRCRCNSKIK